MTADGAMIIKKIQVKTETFAQQDVSNRLICCKT